VLRALLFSPGLAVTHAKPTTSGVRAMENPSRSRTRTETFRQMLTRLFMCASFDNDAVGGRCAGVGSSEVMAQLELDAPWLKPNTGSGGLAGGHDP
jgi:hypothetical protein